MLALPEQVIPPKPTSLPPQDWTHCIRFMTLKGRDSLTARVSEFDASAIHPEIWGPCAGAAQSVHGQRGCQVVGCRCRRLPVGQCCSCVPGGQSCSCVSVGQSYLEFKGSVSW